MIIQSYVEILSQLHTIYTGSERIPFMRELPYEERVELCEKMLKNHRPWTEISKKTGFGPNQISAIKKEKYGIDGSPKHTKAYAMFEERKSNYEVAQL